MMKKKLIGGLLTAAVALSINVTVFAAGWVQNSSGWWCIRNGKVDFE